MKIGVLGASGYAGGELLRLLSGHPDFEVCYIAAGSNAGEKITDLHSHLITYSDQRFAGTDLDAINNCDLIFLALPHGQSAEIVKQVDGKVKIVDLGADFRLRSEQAWKQYYNDSYAGVWAYGLPELPGKRELIKKSSRVANPGCYATAIALAAAPAVLAGGIDASDIVVVAASGTTGAGRSTKVSLSASEIMNSMVSYKFGGVHQHTPEIEQALAELSSKEVKISFTPILAPMPRGILATVTAKTNLLEDEIRKSYEEMYQDEPYVHLLSKGQLPETSSLTGSNSVQMQVAVDTHTSRLIVSVANDNLGKGAAGQAIQNANLISGLVETTGLSALGVGQ